MALISLPNELLLYIMTFLNLSDVKAMSMACRRLHEIFADNRIHENVAIVLHDNLTSALETLKSVGFNVHHLVMKDVTLRSDALRGWQEFWENVKNNLCSFTLYNCDVSESLVVEVLQLCSNLRALHLVGCDSIFMSGNLFHSEQDLDKTRTVLVNVKELDLASNRYLSDRLFNRLVSLMPNVEKLSLASCQLCFHPAIFKRFYPKNRRNADSENVLTFNHVMRFIVGHSSKITSLNFSHTTIDSMSLTDLAYVSNLALRELFLESCDQLTPNGILPMCKNQTSLQSLNLNNCVKVNDNVLTALCKTIEGLRCLCLQSCYVLTDKGIAELSNLKRLQTLKLNNCDKITFDGIEECLNHGGFVQLRYLDLSACLVNEASILLICEKVMRLRYLDLSACRQGVTDDVLQAINKNLTLLCTLKLAWCDKITNYGLGIIEDLGGDSLEGNDTSASHSANLSPLSNLKGLVHLDICSCKNLTDKGLMEALRFCGLQVLNLSLCQQLSDVSLTAIGLQNPSLEKVILSQCHRVTDEGISALVKSLKRLKHLNLQGCRLVTDECLTELTRSCLELQYLDVTLCIGITQDGIEHLRKCLKSLHTIHNRHIDPTTSESFF